MARFPRTEPEVMDLAFPNGIALAQAITTAKNTAVAALAAARRQ